MGKKGKTKENFVKDFSRIKTKYSHLHPLMVNGNSQQSTTTNTQLRYFKSKYARETDPLKLGDWNANKGAFGETFTAAKQTNNFTLLSVCTGYLAKNAQKYFKDLLRLPLELRDGVFLQILKLGNLSITQQALFLHPEIRSLDYSQYGKTMSDGFVDEHIIPRLENMPRDVDDWQDIDDYAIRRATSGCPNLVELNLSYCNISLHYFHRILQDCPLRCLILSHSYPSKSGVIKIHSQRLEILDLSFTTSAFDINCPSLLHLNLAFFRNPLPLTLHSVAISSPNLTYLDLSHNIHFHDEELSLIATNCTSLSVLLLKDASSSLSTMVYKIVNRTSALCLPFTLTYLNLSGCSSFGNWAVIEFVKANKNLLEIDLRHCLLLSKEDLIVECQRLNANLSMNFD